MLLKGLLIIFAFLSASSVYAEQSPVLVEFNDKSYVENEAVELGDVVKNITADVDATKKLLKTKIMNVKLLNSLTKIDYDVLKQQLMPLIGESELVFVNANPSYISRIAQNHDPEQDIEGLMDLIESHFSSMYNNVTIKPLSNHRTLRLPVGDVTYKVKFEDITASKRICVWLDYYVNDEYIKTLPVWFDLTINDYAYVSLRNINDGEVIDIKTLEKKLVDITKHNQPISSIEHLINKRALKDVYEGNVLTHNEVEDVPQIHKGKIVNVVARYGTVVIETKAIAQNDGANGDIILLKRVHDESVFEGIVKSASSVIAVGG